VRYDRLSGRWFVVIVNVDAVNRVMIAVSNSSTITNSSSFTFFGFQHDMVGTTPNSDTGAYCDYPTLGVDKNALYIGCTVFDQADALVGSTGFVVRKASLLVGTLAVTAFRQLVAGESGEGPLAPQGVDNDDPGATQGYFIATDNATY